MNLLPDWKLILKRAWSIRLAVVSAVFSGCEVVLPLFADRFPRGIFAGLSFLAVVGAALSRVVAQSNLHEDKDMQQPPNRTLVAALALSASALVGIVVHEGYSDSAYTPVAGDVPTIGFGTTDGVKLGDTITPPKALVRALTDVQKYEGALKRCVKVPLAQHEYDSLVSLSYNIGPTAFCNSTLVKELNVGNYVGACHEILRWDRFKGKPLRGLTLRRQAEYKQCIGEVG